MKKRKKRKHQAVPHHAYNSPFRRMAEFRVKVLESERNTNELLMHAVVEPSHQTSEGTVVKAVTLPWMELARQLSRNPHFMHQIDWRKWEEIVAGAYKKAGFDEVVLTPRSGDFGRDVIATKNGVLSIRIVGQMKTYKPNHLVTADEVRAMMGVVSANHRASKGVITTTSDFAPRIRSDPLISPLLPSRIELISGKQLCEWLRTLSGESCQ